MIPLGLKTHKVVGSVVVTKNDDNYSQRHELFGVKKLYEHFDWCDVNVNIHGHDRNMVVNKYLKVDQPHVTNTNDIWHVTKGINREIKKFVMVQRNITVFSGMVNSVTKLLPLKLSYYAMKNCEGSAERLKFLLDNILLHYQNVHTNCLDTSRCRTEVSYEPSKTVLKDPVAKKLLEIAIHSLQVYKTHQDCVECIDTHYVESFNNACLIFHDKRIVFGDA